MNLISSKIAKHVDVLKLFTNIALRTVRLQHLLHYDLGLTTHFFAKRYLRLLPCGWQATIYILQRYRCTWWGIIQSSSPSKWIWHSLTHSWSPLDWKVFLITSNLLTAEDQMCEKFLVWLPMKRMSSLILLLVRLVFSRNKFLVVLWQGPIW